MEDAKTSQNKPLENDKTGQNASQAAKTRLRERVIAALLVSPTMEKAAKSCGISTRTVQRMLNDPEFAKEFRDAKTALLQAATTMLTANSAKAAETLLKIFSDRKVPPASRVAAALHTLRLAVDAYQLENLEERLRKLEEQSDAL